MSDTTKPPLRFCLINYGFGLASFYGHFPDRESVEQEFYEKANQCFGIRKSIAGYDLLEFQEPLIEPQEFVDYPTATHVLKHSGDVIVWGPDGEKIKSEWDGL
jgi:hypothetical protein